MVFVLKPGVTRERIDAFISLRLLNPYSAAGQQFCAAVSSNRAPRPMLFRDCKKKAWKCF
jgi:hypothetical protein